MKKINLLVFLCLFALLLSACKVSSDRNGETNAETESETTVETDIESTGTLHKYSLDLNRDEAPEMIVVNQTLAESTIETNLATIRILDGKTGKEIWRDELAMYSEEKGAICLKKYINQTLHSIFYYKYHVNEDTKELVFTFFEFYFGENGAVLSETNNPIERTYYVGDLEHVETGANDFALMLQDIDMLAVSTKDGENDDDFNVYVLIDNTEETLKYSTPTRLVKNTGISKRYRLDEFYLDHIEQ